MVNFVRHVPPAERNNVPLAIIKEIERRLCGLAKTINDVYLELYRRLKENGEIQPSLMARELTAYACHADRHRTASWGHIYLDDVTVDFAHMMCDKCMEGEPIAYILGEWDFYGYTFKINRSVLIPRQDTERVCEVVIERARSRMSPRILDLCCGSGCIGIAAALEVPDAHVMGIDISEGALKISRENAKRLKVSDRYTIFQADVMDNPPMGIGEYDIVVANPPYVSRAEMRELDVSVYKYEPHEALFGGEEGLDFFRPICVKWGKLLGSQGMLIFECGSSQTEQVSEIMEESGFQDVAAINDNSGQPRVVYGYTL